VPIDSENQNFGGFDADSAAPSSGANRRNADRRLPVGILTGVEYDGSPDRTYEPIASGFPGPQFGTNVVHGQPDAPATGRCWRRPSSGGARRRR